VQKIFQTRFIQLLGFGKGDVTMLLAGTHPLHEASDTDAYKRLGSRVR